MEKCSPQNLIAGLSEGRVEENSLRNWWFMKREGILRHVKSLLKAVKDFTFSKMHIHFPSNKDGSTCGNRGREGSSDG